VAAELGASEQMSVVFFDIAADSEEEERDLESRNGE
jgi:hypothetical protein